MRTIHKYQPLSLTENITLRVRRGARTLSVQDQQGVLTFWLEVDLNQPEEDRHYVVVGTGHPRKFEDGTHFYVATVQQGQRVWHIYEKL